MFLLSYAGYQLHIFFTEPYKTQTALEYSISDTEIVIALYVREEYVLSEQASATMMYPENDGKRVIKGTEIAYSYGDTQDILLQNEIQNIEKKSESLKTISTDNSVKISNTSLHNTQILAEITLLKDSCDNGILTEMDESVIELNKLLTERAVITGNCDNLSDTISMYENMINSLNPTVESSQRTYFSPEEGYFVADTDGLEDIYTPKTIENLTVEQIKATISSTEDMAESGSIGKIVTDHNWDIIIPIEEEDKYKYIQGSKLELDFLENDLYEIPSYVSEVIEDENGDFYAVLSCNYIYEDLISERFGEVRVHFLEYTGLRVETDSIRFLNDVKGVYIIRDMQIVFKPIVTVYEGNGFALVDTIYSEENTLRRFDEVITEGEDIYDGKTL